MFYNLTKPFAKVALATYFRKIYFSNQELIPADKPVILAANHPTALIEPCLLACWLKQPLSYIARGDIYLNSFWVRTLYRMYWMVPVFRLQDAGYAHIKDNYESFEKCFKALKDKRVLMILAEGKTIHEKRLRPIMKGTARIVFGTMEKYADMDIHIVPTGINYSNPDRFRSIAMVDFGAPIRAMDYYELYKTEPAKAIKLVTKEISKRLRERVIHIAHKDDDELTEQLLEIKRNTEKAPFLPVTLSDSSILFSEISLADKVNELTEANKSHLKATVSNYFKRLDHMGVTDNGLTLVSSNRIIDFILVAMGFLPAKFGRLVNMPPLLLGNLIAKKMAPSIEFRASIAGVFGTLIWLFYFGVIITALILLGNLLSSVWALIVPVLGYFSIIYSEYLNNWKEGRKANNLNRTALKELKDTRNTILNFISVPPEPKVGKPVVSHNL